MKMSSDTNVTSATINAVSGLSRNPRVRCVEPKVSHVNETVSTALSVAPLFDVVSAVKRNATDITIDTPSDPTARANAGSFADFGNSAFTTPAQNGRSGMSQMAV